MKQLVFFTCINLFCLTIYAQQIVVKSFCSLSKDLDARVSFPKEDKNGEKAALIKIVTTETSFEFDGGMIGIVAVIPKTSEIWLYVPRGSKVVTIKHPKLGLLRNYAYPQSIEAGEVYEMVLTTGKVITTIEEPTIETQWLIINTEPAGADLYINDLPAGKTPYQNELPTGKYTWRVLKELYLPEAGIAELQSSGQRQLMNVKLKPDFGTLSLSTIPESGAKVSLNGIETGKTTPCNIEKVPSGEHTISLNLDMYETTSQHITLAAGETQKVAINMNPTFAQVTVTSEPATDIYINSQFKANANWQGRLNPGVYTFEAKLEKYNTATEKKTVIVGQPLNVKLTPTPRTGNLKIVTTPYDATIKIDGRDLGKTPLTLKNQLIGDYTVEISLLGYSTSYTKVNIAEGETAQINETLLLAQKMVVTDPKKSKSVDIQTDVTLEPVLSGITSDQVIQNYISAIGGKQKISKVKDLIITAGATMQNIPISLDYYFKAPDKFLVKVGSGNMVFAKQVYYVDRGVASSPMSGETKTIEGEELTRMKEAALIFPEMYYTNLGYTTELIGIEEFKDGKKCYKIQVNKGGDRKDFEYYDLQTALKMRTEGKQGSTEYSNYQAIDGILFPYSTTQNIGTQTVVFVVSSIKLNTKLKDDFFEVK